MLFVKETKEDMQIEKTRKQQALQEIEDRVIIQVIPKQKNNESPEEN